MKVLDIQEPIGAPPTFTLMISDKTNTCTGIRLQDNSSEGVDALLHATGCASLETAMSVVVKIARAMGNSLSEEALNQAAACLHEQRPRNMGDAMAAAHAIGLWHHTMEAMGVLAAQDTLEARGVAIGQLSLLSNIADRASKRMMRPMPTSVAPHNHLHIHGGGKDAIIEAIRVNNLGHDAIDVQVPRTPPSARINQPMDQRPLTREIPT